MIVLESKTPDGRLAEHAIRSDVLLGSHSSSPIAMSRSAGPRAVRLTFDRNGLATIGDMGCGAGVFVNNERIVRYGPLREHDNIVIAGQSLCVKSVGDKRAEPSSPVSMTDVGPKPPAAPPALARLKE